MTTTPFLTLERVSWQLPDGRLLFCGSRGLLVVEPLAFMPSVKRSMLSPTGLRSMKRRNSARVRASSRKVPSILLVTMLTPRLWMPRVVMHSCEPSTTTPTPSGCSTSWMTSAICAVIFSCTWKRRA